MRRDAAPARNHNLLPSVERPFPLSSFFCPVCKSGRRSAVHREHLARSEAARLMGQARTPAKAKTSRVNGALGGRPKKNS